MKNISNNSGIALVTSLMFTVLSLVITMTLLYMVTTGIRSSGAVKRYKTITEAAYGGADIMLKDILSKSIKDGINTTLSDAAFKSSMQSYLVGLTDLQLSDCLRLKVLNPNSKWTSACANNSLEADRSYDVKFNLNAALGSSYVVYSKIVDTAEYKLPVFSNSTLKYVSIAGNSDPFSLNTLEGEAVVDNGTGGGGGGGGITNPHKPYIYRIEVKAERSQNASEKSKLSVQYVY